MISFNRTFMELKSEVLQALILGENSFNRTFMELKFYFFLRIFAPEKSFNRTFMELKSDRTIRRNYGSQKVLIVPLWN